MDTKNSNLPVNALETVLAHAGRAPDPVTGGVAPPLHPATTFARGRDYELPSGYGYARNEHPGTTDLQALLQTLDGAAASLVFGAGMAGIVTLLHAVLTDGGHVAAPAVMYHGTRDWLRELTRSRGVDVTWYEAGNKQSLEQAVRSGETSLVWTEVAVNPTWDVIDIAHAAEVAHGAGALLAVDATIAPPVTCRPLALGADFVFQSATKYLNGHSDVTAGVVSAARDDGRVENMRTHRTLTGAAPGAFESWLLLRGLRTLALRFDRASRNAMTLAEHFQHHDAISAVLYPGLPSHPGHAAAARQMTNGFGGMLSLRVNGGRERALDVAGRLNVFVRATSLGGVESLVEHRATIEGPDSPVPDDLLRMSIGIEAVEDLIADLEQALE